MNSEMAAEPNERRYVIHPAKFTLWLFIVSIILFFGGLTSAFIVSKGIEMEKDMWHFFELPNVLWLNTAILVVSSAMIQIGLWGAQKGDLRRARIGLTMASVLGLIFLVGQVIAWQMLDEEGVVWGKGGSNSGNYMYLLTFVHGLHIVAGLAFIGYVFVKLVLQRGKLSFQKGGTISLMAFENAVTFWHFLGLLWLYLFIFLLMNQGQPMV
ncbi:MAG: cytochrome c oxidase subunit 3 [Bacteroidota bacterium]